MGNHLDLLWCFSQALQQTAQFNAEFNAQFKNDLDDVIYIYQIWDTYFGLFYKKGFLNPKRLGCPLSTEGILIIFK